jgi:uncharacterized protein (TIGR02452 family)
MSEKFIYNPKHKTHVIEYNCIDLAIELAKRGKSILLHNFANNYTPCDDCFMGNTQEEQIFRRSNIKDFLTIDLYPIDITDKVRVVRPGLIISKDILFDNDVKFDVATSAALIGPETIELSWPHNNKYIYKRPEEENIMAQKIHMLLKEAEKYDYFVTGAWGMGVFDNPEYGLLKIWNNLIPLYNVRAIFAVPPSRRETFLRFLTIVKKK